MVEAAGPEGLGVEGLRAGRGGVDLGRLGLHADGGVGADHDAATAVDAQVGLPHGQLVGQAALLVARRAHRERAVDGQRAHREQVALAGEHGGGDAGHELRHVLGHRGAAVAGGGHDVGDGHLVQRAEGEVDGGVVASRHLVATAPVGVGEPGLELGEGGVEGEHPREGEERRQHHRVHPAGQAGLAGHPVGVDDPQVQPTVDDLGLHLGGQVVPGVLGRPGGVDQDRGAGFGHVEHVEALEQVGVVAGHETGATDEVRGADRAVRHPQVRHRDRTGLLRVVHEVALHVAVGVLADELRRGLVGAHRAVAAEAVEHGAHLGGVGVEGGVHP